MRLSGFEGRSEKDARFPEVPDPINKSTPVSMPRDRVRDVMSLICPEGYRQAVELLVLGDIKSDAAQIKLAATVVVGGADTVTPPDGCRSVAESFSSSTFHVLLGLGHACYVEGPDAFNDVLSDHLGRQ